MADSDSACSSRSGSDAAKASVPGIDVKVYLSICKLLLGRLWTRVILPLLVGKFSHVFFLWQGNLGTEATLDQKKSDLGDSAIENSDFLGYICDMWMFLDYCPWRYLVLGVF